MAIGTPIDRGNEGRNSNANQLNSNTFTPSADSLLLCWVQITASAAIPDTLVGHDGGTSWVQIGTTIDAGGRSASLWGAHSGSSPSSGTIDVDRSTTNPMGALFAEVTGVDVSGTVANSFVQTDQLSEYGNSPAIDLTGATNPTIHFWATTSAAITTEAGNTELNTFVFDYGTPKGSCDYNASGDTTPTVSLSQNNWCRQFGLELKEASGTGPQTLSPSAIASSEAFGTAVISTGVVTVSPTGITSAESFGTPVISNGAVTLSPSAIASAESFGTPALSVGVVQLQPSAIPSAEAFGTAVITVGAAIISPDGIVSEEGFGVAVITGGVPPVILEGLTQDLTFDLTLALTRDITGA